MAAGSLASDRYRNGRKRRCPGHCGRASPASGCASPRHPRSTRAAPVQGSGPASRSAGPRGKRRDRATPARRWENPAPNSLRARRPTGLRQKRGSSSATALLKACLTSPLQSRPRAGSLPPQRYGTPSRVSACRTISSCGFVLSTAAAGSAPVASPTAVVANSARCSCLNQVRVIIEPNRGHFAVQDS